MMLRSIAILVLGGLVGAVVAMAVIGGADEAAAPGSDSRSLLEGISGVASRGDEQRLETVSVAETLAAYREAAAEPDAAAIRRTLEVFAAEPWSPARDVEIDALLARLADFDPAYAASLSLALGLELHFVADAYVNWATVDPAAAIGALATIAGRSDRLEIALALLDVIGNDAAGVQRVATGLAGSDASLLAVESIVVRAEYEPFAAFRDAVALPEMRLQSTALSEIGTAWAAQDPRGAIAQAEQLPEQLKTSFRSGVFSEWARLDGADFLAWLASTSEPPREAMVGVNLLAGAQIDQLLGIADALPGDQGEQMRIAAYRALAEADPEQAMSRAAATPTGPDRETILMIVASTVASSDPEAAFEWARGISPPARNLMSQITFSMVQNDPLSTIALMDNPPEGVDPQLFSSILSSTISRDPESAETVADALVVRDSIQAANALRNVVAGWMQQDPERALEWVLAHDAVLDAAIIGPAAQAMSRSDPVAAAGYVERLPDQYRSAWITQVAGAYGLRDPNGALAWISQYQGQDFYDNALRQVISASAQSDAAAAARMLSQSSGDVQLGAATQVAQALAQQDPREAVRWAVSLSEPRARQGAVAASVMLWAGRDLTAARNFTLGLDRGETRDQALTAVIRSMSQSGEFDRDLLDSYSSDAASQEALASVIPVIARTDRDEAEDLLPLVTSANTRRSIEDRIAALD